jgi:hypothetical protein
MICPASLFSVGRSLETRKNGDEHVVDAPSAHRIRNPMEGVEIYALVDGTPALTLRRESIRDRSARLNRQHLHGMVCELGVWGCLAM